MISPGRWPAFRVTAQYLNSGIFPTGSSASFVIKLAAASLNEKGIITTPHCIPSSARVVADIFPLRDSMINISPDLSESNLGSKILSSTVFDLENNNNFTEFLKGLFLKVEPQTSGAIIYFDTNSPNCFLRMTYTKNDDTQAVIDFPVGGEANTHNYFTHSYENAELLNYLQNEKMDSLIFLQSMGGLAAEIDLSFL